MSSSKSKSIGLDHEQLELKRTEMILRTTKEVVVKFIEMGKVTPVTFDEVFQTVYSSVERAVRKDLTRTK